ncbi:hypothetical protein [Streptomyces sp. NBC_00670]|jgi:hypothetical protein|uniref:hypothetical protein n=1 Tax=Streptomyces sp. NBC_00670 TaxID=2975804 RepID=UPI002E375A5A|nr:hypothetical protein [Streptomyces sp. NBC_00670]
MDIVPVMPGQLPETAGLESVVMTAVVFPFAAAPDGWRVAIKCPDDGMILVMPIVGWATPVDGMRRTDHQLAVEPVILFDNVDEPLITTLADTLHDWTDGETLHQIIAPGFEVREVPDGWSVREYGD